MGAFAPPHWKIWFSADLKIAESAIRKGGGDLGQGVYQLGSLGRLIDAKDPHGNDISAIELAQEPPENDLPGDPVLAEYWGTDVLPQAVLLADVLGLECSPTPFGAKLTDHGEPRIFLRNAPFDLPKPILIPYFLSTGVGGDCERARRAGGIVQVHTEIVEDLGELAVLSDPSGAFFGLVDPTK